MLGTVRGLLQGTLGAAGGASDLGRTLRLLVWTRVLTGEADTGVGGACGLSCGWEADVIMTQGLQVLPAAAGS